MMIQQNTKLLLPVTYMGVLFILSSVPGDLPEDRLTGLLFEWFSPNWQNLLHLPLYGGLIASWLWALAGRQISHFVWLGLSLLITISWAAIDEIHQLSVPGRYASFTDLALDILGACLVAAYVGLRPRLLRQSV